MPNWDLQRCAQIPGAGRNKIQEAILAATGYPLAADELYGGGKRLFLSQIQSIASEDDTPLIERAALHAVSLELIHPDQLNNLLLTAPYANDFVQVVIHLGGKAGINSHGIVNSLSEFGGQIV